MSLLSIDYKFGKIPSYDECVEMCSKINSPFYETKSVIEGYNISVFNYRIAQLEDFVNPIPNREVDGFEMRGITFVFNRDGTLFNRYLLLNKFFNLNQNKITMYDVVKNFKIRNVNLKEDGSVVSFIKLPNGKIIGKTKVGFSNDQSQSTNKILEGREDIRNFVKWSLDNDIIAIFEYVSPKNKIVVDYYKDDLILLKLRDNKTGKYLEVKDYLDKIGTIKIASFLENFGDLDDLIDLVNSSVGIEGYVVHCHDHLGGDFLFKIKTPWYLSLHGLYTDEIRRENNLISLILDDKIDDILSLVSYEIKEEIKNLTFFIREYVKRKAEEIILSHRDFMESNLTRKEFYLIRGKDKIFYNVMSVLSGKDPYDVAKSEVLKNTSKLQKARDFLKKEGFTH